MKIDSNYSLNVFDLLSIRGLEVYTYKQLGCTILVAYSRLSSTIPKSWLLMETV